VALKLPHHDARADRGSIAEYVAKESHHGGLGERVGAVHYSEHGRYKNNGRETGAFHLFLPHGGESLSPGRRPVQPITAFPAMVMVAVSSPAWRPDLKCQQRQYLEAATGNVSEDR
jgi:hypothetical protein